MYVSPAVRSIQRHPIDGETATLLVRLDDAADVETVAEQIRECGGTIEQRLEFDALAITVDHSAVASICELDGLSAVETDDTLTMGADGAGEDVRLGDQS
ncbi:hypothetical protein Hrd1104_11480 [Halorhabdus sp. CBA1104]|jgi:hypothetical protein|uniref:hypothetical protein n=1 Tax=Halorhabdus sp. CBA1104 TaxID=1380432 RepID=UPI0012B2F507|nr:hypothetical protein [Halorhabdus sp. CBA1104]QGN07860.1 hypothetical protein Hrd1104_11480 [Halorhabdus sp. CBA1104]